MLALITFIQENPLGKGREIPFGTLIMYFQSNESLRNSFESSFLTDQKLSSLSLIFF